MAISFLGQVLEWIQGLDAANLHPLVMELARLATIMTICSCHMIWEFALLFSG